MTDPKDVQGEAELKTRRRRFDGWRVVLVGALILAIASDPVAAVGLPRIAEIALGDLWTVHGHVALFAIAHLVFTGALPALLLPFVGWGVDRWGSRRMVLYGLITLSAGFVLYLGAQVTAVFYLVIAMVSIRGVVESQLPIATAVNNWFRRRRALAMAVMWLPWRVPIALMAGVGSLNLFNREVGLLLIAAIVFVIAWPVSRLLRNRPEDYGQHPDGIDPASVPKEEPTQSTGGEPLTPEYAWREALKTRAFWMLALGGCGHAITVFGMTNFASVFVDRGFSPTHAGRCDIAEFGGHRPVLAGRRMARRPLAHPSGDVRFCPGAVCRRFPADPLLVTTHVLLFKRAFGHRNRGRDPAQVCRCRGLFRTPQLRHDNRSVLVGRIHRGILGGPTVGLCAACFRLHPGDISPRFGDCCCRAGIPVRGRAPAVTVAGPDG